MSRQQEAVETCFVGPFWRSITRRKSGIPIAQSSGPERAIHLLCFSILELSVGGVNERQYVTFKRELVGDYCIIGYRNADSVPANNPPSAGIPPRRRTRKCSFSGIEAVLTELNLGRIDTTAGFIRYPDPDSEELRPSRRQCLTRDSSKHVGHFLKADL